MEIQKERVDGVVIVRPAGGLDNDQAAEFQAFVHGLLREGDHWMVLDFTRTEQIGGKALQVLRQMRAKLIEPFGGLVLCAMNDRVKESFRIPGYLGVFAVTPSLPEAISRLARAQSQKRFLELVASLLKGDEPAAADGGEPAPFEA